MRQRDRHVIGDASREAQLAFRVPLRLSRQQRKHSDRTAVDPHGDTETRLESAFTTEPVVEKPGDIGIVERPMLARTQQFRIAVLRARVKPEPGAVFGQ